MKKLFTILLSFIIVLTITGCLNKNELQIGKESKLEIIEEKASLSVLKETLTNKGATFIIKNDSDKIIKYDNSYEIEINKHNKWYKTNVELDFILDTFEIAPNVEGEMEINWENSYGELNRGKYRLIKKVSLEEYDTNSNNYIVAEFTI